MEYTRSVMVWKREFAPSRDTFPEPRAAARESRADG